MLNITEIRIRLIDKEDSKLRAVASMTIDNCFVVHDIKVIEGDSGFFVPMPSRKTPDGLYKDIAHPIDTDTRNAISEKVLDEYKKALNEAE